MNDVKNAVNALVLARYRSLSDVIHVLDARPRWLSDQTIRLLSADGLIGTKFKSNLNKANRLSGTQVT